MARFCLQLWLVLALVMVALCADNATTPAAVTTTTPTTPTVTTQKPEQNFINDIKHVILDIPEAVAKLCKDKATAVYDLFQGWM